MATGLGDTELLWLRRDLVAVLERKRVAMGVKIRKRLAILVVPLTHEVDVLELLRIDSSSAGDLAGCA